MNLIDRKTVHTYTHGTKKVYDLLETYTNIKGEKTYIYTKHFNLILGMKRIFKNEIPKEIKNIFNKGV
jgi:hypothetical protein